MDTITGVVCKRPVHPALFFETGAQRGLTARVGEQSLDLMSLAVFLL